MKAKEYAEKYRQLGDHGLPDEERLTTLGSLFNEMLDEMKDVIIKRKVKSDSAFEALKKEFNQKGNAISGALGGSLTRDWFFKMWDMAKKSADKGFNGESQE